MPSPENPSREIKAEIRTTRTLAYVFRGVVALSRTSEDIRGCDMIEGVQSLSFETPVSWPLGSTKLMHAGMRTQTLPKTLLSLSSLVLTLALDF